MASFFEKIKCLNLQKSNYLWLALALALGAASNYPLVHGQYVGNDEVGQRGSSERIIDAVKGLDVEQLSITVANQYHPPLKYIMPIPGLLVSETEFAHRFMTICASFLLIIAMYLFSFRYFGDHVANIATLLLASSSVFNYFSMVFGWNYVAIFLVASLFVLEKASLDLKRDSGRRAFNTLSLLSLGIFLINQNGIVFATTVVLIFLMKNKIQSVAAASLPYLIFYALYYFAIFIVIPYMAYELYGYEKNFGQLWQYEARYASAGLNIDSFVENMKGINAYFFPFIAWIVSFVAIKEMLAKHQSSLLLFAPFVLVWSFYMQGHSAQYYLIFFAVTLPYAVNYFYGKLHLKNYYMAGIVVALLTAYWNYTIFIKSYTDVEQDQVVQIEKDWFSFVSRRHNIVYPYKEISNFLEKSPDKKFIHDMSLSFSRYYHNDRQYSNQHHSSYLGRLGSDRFPVSFSEGLNCYQIKFNTDSALIISERRLCQDQFSKVVTFKNSRVKAYVGKD